MVKLILYSLLTGCNAFISTNGIVLMKMEMVLRDRKRGAKEKERGKKTQPSSLYQVVWNHSTVLLSEVAAESNPEHNWLQMKHFNIKSWVVPWSCSSGLHELHVSAGKMCLFFFSFCKCTFYFSLLENCRA